MNHPDCITDSQGRAPCTCGGLRTANSDGSSQDSAPWDWIDEVAYAVHFAIFCGIGTATSLALLILIF